VAIGIALRALPGEHVCGDACESMAWSRGALIAIADGLGHGPQAAAASKAFVACVRARTELPLDETFADAHRALLRTRGAVGAIARFDQIAGQVEVAVVGNVGALLVHAGVGRTEHPLVASGVLGSAYRTVRAQRLAFDPGDLLVLHTDGLRSHLDVKGLHDLPAHAAAQALLASHCKSNDDAGCAVAFGLLEGSGASPSPPSGSVAPSFEGSRAIPVRERSDADCVALAARTFSREAGLGVRAQWEVGIAASELATNMIKFAGSGEIRLRREPTPRAAVVVEAVDRGAGIADLDAALADGFSEGASLSPDRPRREGQGLGVGLGSVHRMMDRVEFETDHGGTRVVARKFLP